VCGQWRRAMAVVGTDTAAMYVDDEQHLLPTTRPVVAAAENWHRGKHSGYLRLWRV